jgi:biopolymer transport protein ExbB
MFQGKNVLEILNMGGFTMYILLALSVVSLGIILERVFHYRSKTRVKRETFMAKIRETLAAHDFAAAIAYCDTVPSLYSQIIREGIAARGLGMTAVKNAMDRRISVEVEMLERFTAIVGSIGGTVVYVGLFGTVIGIIRAFHDILLTATTGGGMSLVISGIAEALICTASGIAVAVPSVIAYNLLSRKIESMRLDMERAASEAGDLIAAGSAAHDATVSESRAHAHH